MWCKMNKTIIIKAYEAAFLLSYYCSRYRCLQEYSVSEVSEVTGWSNSNTKIILHRSRNKMKEVLSDLLNIDNKELY